MTDKIRRITKRAVAQGDEAELAALIGGALRVGTLEGVHVDFRHPQLPSDWEAQPWWNVWGPPPQNAGIIFPGEAQFGIESLRDEKKQPDLPAIFAQPGDRISIEDVQIEHGNRCFDHPHDKEVRLARLRIERPSGEVLHAGPLAFFGTGSIVGHATREAFDHIIERTLGHAGVAEFPSHWAIPEGGDYWGNSIEHAALNFASDAHRAYFELLDGMPSFEDGGGEQRANLRILANSAALAGFLLAKIESQKPERMAAAILVNRDKATKAATRTDWHQRAREIWEGNPCWTTNRVAELIADEDETASVSSIARSLANAKIAPSSSPSYKA